MVTELVDTQKEMKSMQVISNNKIQGIESVMMSTYNM